MSSQVQRASAQGESAITESVQHYYSEVLRSSSDLKTSACCPLDAMPAHLKPLVANIDDAIIQRFYGCGSPIPSALSGCRVLDLGCGTGRDVFLLSQLVGSEGFVHGVDMTPDQIALAEQLTESHMKRFGYGKSNVAFHRGFMEDLSSLGIEDNSLDVVVSNCVINLSPAKERVFSEIFRVLKPGGELYFSDVFADRRVPKELMQDPTLLGECLAGALYYEDFRRMLGERGVADVRLCARSPIQVQDLELAKRLGPIAFYSLTVRAFKLSSLEDRCEDYGQFAVYRGGLADSPVAFVLDDHHRFERGRPMAVCGNTAAMLQETRYRDYFEIIGDRSQHFGLFPCGPVANEVAPSTSCC